MSITKNSEILEQDVMGAIFKKCDYTVHDLVKTRIISPVYPVFQEVLVFKDENSQMKDKTTALGVTLAQSPNGGGVDIYLIRGCPAKPYKLIIGK